MALKTERLAATEKVPHALEVASKLLSPCALLLFLSLRLPGLKVIAKKSWALTDDFEAYFLYKGRLFVMETPYVNVWVSLLGRVADEQLFSEVEAQVRCYSFWVSFLTPIAVLRYAIAPFNPPDDMLKQHDALPSATAD
jgi:uncharacterized membrane protein